jgi:hypothetical protein
MNGDLALVVAPRLELAPSWCRISEEAVAQKEEALANSALIGAVRNREQNDEAGAALARLQTLSRSLEAHRKEITDPFVEAQRTAKRIVDEFRDDIDREAGRVEELMKSFAIEERRRAREVEEAQRRELERIEREKQAELRRIQEEQARRDQAARDAREAAERLAREAREAAEAAERAARHAQSKAEREAAVQVAQQALAVSQSAQQTAFRAETCAQQSAEIAEERALLVTERAELATRLEAKPVEITRTRGQSTRKRMRITQINDFALLKARPDLVRTIEWDRAQILEILNSGGQLPGVTAEEDLSISVRQRKPRTIEV